MAGLTEGDRVIEGNFMHDFGLPSTTRLEYITLLAADGRNLRHEMIDNIDFSGVSSVLEAGCSDIPNLMLIRKRRHYEGRLVGVDTDPSALEMARKKQDRAGITPVELIEEDMANLPLEDNSQDVSIAAWSLHHAKSDDHLHRALDELARVTKPDSPIILALNSEEQKILHTIMLAKTGNEMGRVSPSRFAGRLCLENAVKVLREHPFELVDINMQETDMVLRRFDDLRISLGTYLSLFDPPIDTYEAVQQAVRIWMRVYADQMNEWGSPVVDNISRGIIRLRNKAA